MFLFSTTPPSSAPWRVRVVRCRLASAHHALVCVSVVWLCVCLFAYVRTRGDRRSASSSRVFGFVCLFAYFVLFCFVFTPIVGARADVRGCVRGCVVDWGI